MGVTTSTVRKPTAERREEIADAALRIIGTRGIAALPEEQRTALVLAEYQELPVAEIAAIMACSLKAAESRLYHARQTLRRQLAPLLP